MVDVVTTFRRDGFIIREGVLAESQILELKRQLAQKIEIEAEKQAGRVFRDYGMLLAAPVYGGALLKLVEHEILFEPVDALLGAGAIIHVYTSSSIPPHSKNYATRIHHERSNKYPDIPDFVALIIALDDFNAQNGATWFLPGSHLTRDLPKEEIFYAQAKRLLMPAGSVFYFDWRLYHAGGENTTDTWRHALAMGMTPAYHKQKIDLPRAIPADIASSITDYAKQKLGYFSVPPTSMDDYYLPEDKRTYRQPPV
jgi:ectoine hydroxylase-related dioxygenase (phytanoyl-CoA dioxygenase family)